MFFPPGIRQVGSKTCVYIYIYSKLTDKPFIEKEPRGKWLALLRIKTWHMNKQPDSYNKKESLK